MDYKVKENNTPESAGDKLPNASDQLTAVKNDPITTALHSNTKVKTTEDDDTLINVHIGNPLRRITELLEDIKKQKAFSFTLKGSLGIMGVVLTFSLLGFFGTTHALCDKGIQTHIGSVRVLQVTDGEPDNVLARIQQALVYIQSIFAGKQQTSPRYRYILITADDTTIHLNRGRDAALSPFKDQHVYATGIYDSCSRQLTIETPAAIEIFTSK